MIGMSMGKADNTENNEKLFDDRESVIRSIQLELAERYSPKFRNNPEYSYKNIDVESVIPLTEEELLEGACWASFIASDGLRATRSLSYREVAEAAYDAILLSGKGNFVESTENTVDLGEFYKTVGNTEELFGR